MLYKVKKYKIVPRAVPQNIYEKLDEEQQNAVLNSEGRSIIIAGPGSGKTRVVTYKIVHLISGGVSPKKILLMTFTKAAAKEMISRARQVTGRDLNEMVAGTFHSVCNLFLRKYAQHIGYDNNFTILDRDDSKDLMRLVRSRVLSRMPSEMKKLIPHPEVLVSINSYMMNTLSDLSTAIKRKNPMLLDNYEIISEILAEYSIEKKKQNVMDFDDLLVNTLRLLQEKPKVKERLSEQFEWILVDEFQDTNKVQYMIVEELASKHGNIFVVGDDAQSIYSFRGARFENVEDFINVPGTRIFRIQTNYRSTQSIVDLVNALIPTRSVPKVLKAVRPGGEKPVVVKTFDEEEQAQFVGQRIEELVEEGLKFSDIAVLYRTHKFSMRIEMELASRGIPYRILSGLRFVELAHIKDVLAFLRIVLNPLDAVSWVRVSKLFEGVGDKTASKLADTVSRYIQSGVSYLDAIDAVRSSRRTRLHRLKEILENMKDMQNPGEMIDFLMDDFYEEYLSYRYEDAEERAQDVRKLSDLASRYENLERFLSDITTAEGVESEGEVSEHDSVTLSTVHQAKGLEWKAVFVISVNPGDFPNVMALREGNLDEEERLFYVAITRAKDQLYIIHQIFGSANPYVENYIKFSKGMNFVEKIPEDLVEFWEV